TGANKPAADKAGAEKRPAAPAPGAAARRGAAAQGAAAPGAAPGKPGNGKPAAANGTAPKAAAVAPTAGKAAPAAAPVPPIEELETNSYRNIFVMAGAISTSLIVHLGVIIMLGLIFVVVEVVSDPPHVEAITEREQEVVTQIVDNSTVASTNMSAPSQSVAAANAGHSSALSSSVDPPALETEVAPESEISVNVGALQMVQGVPTANFSADLPDGT